MTGYEIPQGCGHGADVWPFAPAALPHQLKRMELQREVLKMYAIVLARPNRTGNAQVDSVIAENILKGTPFEAAPKRQSTRCTNA